MSTMPPPPEPGKDEIIKYDESLSFKDRKHRANAAVAMRVEGVNYAQIARMLDYPDATTARMAVEQVLAETVGESDREKMRDIESRRLERLMRAMFKRATDDNDPEQISATKTAVAILDRHIRLHGLDSPQQMVVYNPSAVEIQEWLEEAARSVREATPEEADVIDGEAWEEG